MGAGTWTPLSGYPFCLSRFALCVYRAFSAAGSQGFDHCRPGRPPRKRGRAGTTGQRAARPIGMFTMSNSPSRSRARIAASGFCLFASLTPSRGGRSAERRSGARRNTRGTRHNAACQALARCLASHDAGRSPLGAPPWRFWALRVPRFPLRRPPQLTLRQADRSQRAPRVQVLVPGGRGPYLPGQRLRAAAAGRHTSLRIQDASRTRPH
jgi:hypothetical protein